MADPLNKCVWMWAGLLSYRLCDRSYECAACPVERLFHPVVSSEAAPAPRPGPVFPYEPTSFESAPDRFQDLQHLWLRVLPQGRTQVGLDPMAARILRTAQEIRLPEVGTRVKRGDPAITVRVPGGELAFASPLTGEVERVHQIAHSRLPAALSRPYSRAWVMVLRVSRLERQLERLLIGREARSYLMREWRHFREECLRLTAGEERTALPAMPDGGDLDLARLERVAGAPYHLLIRRCLGEGRLHELGRGGGPI